MTTSVLRTTSSRRDRAARWAGTVLVVSIAGAAGLTAAVAARRTDTAFARRLSSANAADVNLSVDAEAAGSAALRPLDAIDTRPFVAGHARYGGVYLVPVHDGRVDRKFFTGTATGYVAYDERAGRTISTVHVLSGRLPAADRADEVMVNPAWVRITGWGVGARMPGMKLFQAGDLDESLNPIPSKGTPVSLRVVGIVSTPEEDIARGDVVPRVVLTPAFARRFPDAPYYYQELLKLRRGASDVPKLDAAVAQLRGGRDSPPLFSSVNQQGLTKAQQANDPLVTTLWMLAALALIVGLVLAAQSCARVFQLRSDDQAQLRVLGATREQRFLSEMASATSALALAAVLAVGAAWLLSPLTPVGEARTAEPHSGMAFHAGLALAAVAALVVLGAVAAMPSAWKVATSTALPGPSATAASDRSSLAARTAAGLGLGVPAVMGTRLALQPGRGRSATPVRSVLASLTVVVAAVTLFAAFDVNLRRLTDTPHLYGWDWDVAFGTPFGTIPQEAVGPFTHDDRVAGAAGLTLGALRTRGIEVPAIGLQHLSGDLTAHITSGRAPRTLGEIALGAKTLRRVDAHVGDVIDTTVDGRAHRLRIVGTATFPGFGATRFSEAGLGTGALGLAGLFPQDDPEGRYNYVLLRYKASIAKPAAIGALRRQLFEAGCVDATCVLTDLRPSEIEAFRNARGMQVPVALLLAVLLIATLAHVLRSTLRHRAADLAILHALGCVGRQIAATLRWQTVVLTGSALLIGVPLGLIGNRFVWRSFTYRFGVSPGTRVPVALLFAGAATVVVTGALVGTVGGRRASRSVRSSTLPN